MNFRLGNRPEWRKEIEIAPLIGLANMLRVERTIATWITWRGLLPGSTTAADFLLRDMEMNAPRRDVHLYLVAGAHKSERAADKAFRRDVENARAIARTAHACIGNAQHVANALFQQLFRDRQHAPFRHAGTAFWAAVLEHEDMVRCDVEIVAFDLAGHVVVVLECDDLAAVTQQAFVRR